VLSDSDASQLCFDVVACYRDSPCREPYWVGEWLRCWDRFALLALKPCAALTARLRRSAA
jgi:hypothetical protein